MRIKGINRALFLLFVQVVTVQIGTAQEQEHSDYLLRKVGNLYILNVGANDGVKGHTVYNLYFEKDKRLPLIRLKYKTEREYFGTVQVTQLFPEYSVVRIISRVMAKEPEGNRIVLVSKGLPEKLMRRVKGFGDVWTEPEDILPKEEPVIKEVVTNIKDESYKPFSVGINYFREFDEIAKPITNNLQQDLNTNIYFGNGLFTSSFSSNGGINLTASKMLTSFLAVEGGLTYINQKSTLKSVRNPEYIPDVGLVSVKEWDFDIKTSILSWSLTAQVSQFSKAVSFFTGRELNRRYAPRIGIGVNYATVEVKMDQRVVIEKLFGEEEQAPSDKKSLGGYWGMHAVAGVDYYLQHVKLFAEIQYTTWFSDKFNSDIPFRVGAAVLF